MLKEYSTSPEQGWKAKDCAIFLVLALAVQGKTAAAGGGGAAALWLHRRQCSWQRQRACILAAASLRHGRDTVGACFDTASASLLCACLG